MKRESGLTTTATFSSGCDLRRESTKVVKWKDEADSERSPSQNSRRRRIYNHTGTATASEKRRRLLKARRDNDDDDDGRSVSYASEPTGKVSVSAKYDGTCVHAQPLRRGRKLSFSAWRNAVGDRK